MSADGKWIHCDGEHCQEMATLPIALRSRLMPSYLRKPVADGWLFIMGSGPGRHFCPRCAAAQLDRIADWERKVSS